ncbi:MAG: glycoside hydrolase [Dehalococcoidia bacterium]
MRQSRQLSRRHFTFGGAIGLASIAMSQSYNAVVAAGMRASHDSAPTATVSAVPSQTMQGFGAAGAWWPHDLVHFNPEVQEHVADLLFGPDGINLSAYRYNVGGGGVGITNPVRAPETFLVSPGRYDWTRDPGGRRFLSLAAERGVPALIGFVNSAPSIWTTNGLNRGGYLQPGTESDYARYLTDVVSHFHEAEGITLSYLSPMNEPDHLFSEGGQEGMGVPVEQRAPVIQAIGQELAARAPYCRVIADESSRVGEQFIREVGQWLEVPGTAEYVAALAHHRYDFPNDITIELARELAERYDKPLWFTEICCFDTRTGIFGPQYDPTIRGALMMANLIWQGLTQANDAAFHWWVACSSALGIDPSQDPDAVAQVNEDGWNDGLLYYDPNYAENGNQRIYPTKRYYAMGNFSRYVRPGARRHDVIGTPRNLRVMAFANGPIGPTDGARAQRPTSPIATPPAQRPTAAGPIRATDEDGAARGWTIVVINNAPLDAPSTTLHLQLPGTEFHQLTVSTAVETSTDLNLEPAPAPHVSDTVLLTAHVAAQSITTYVLLDTEL